MILLKHEDDVAENPEKSQIPPGQPVIGGNLSRDEWVRAVLSGADDRSPRWRHALVLGGLFLGFEARNQMGLQGQLRRTVGGAVVTAVHAALEEVRLGGEEEGAHAAVLVLNYCFDLLDDRDKTGIDYDVSLLFDRCSHSRQLTWRSICYPPFSVRLSSQRRATGLDISSQL